MMSRSSKVASGIALLARTLVLALPIVLTGCFAQQLAPASAGRSRVEQALLSTDIDKAVNQMTESGFDALNGKKVFVRVGDLEDNDTVSDYVRVALEHRLTEVGVIPADVVEEADAVLVIRVRVAGSDTQKSAESFGILPNPGSLLFTINSQWAAAELEAQAYERKTNKILFEKRPTGAAKNSYRAVVLLPAIPIISNILTFETVGTDSEAI